MISCCDMILNSVSIHRTLVAGHASVVISSYAPMQRRYYFVVF